MTPQQNRQIIARAVTEGMAKQAEIIRKQTVQQLYAVLLLTLHDKHNFTSDKLVEVFEQIVEQFDCINDKYVKIEDFYSLLEELGINVKEG